MAVKKRLSAQSRNWLLLAFRWAWWPVALACLLLYFAGLWSLIPQAGSLAALQAVVGPEVAGQLGAALAALGWPGPLYLALLLLPEVLAAVTFVSIGLLIRLRRSDDWFSLFASLWMIVFGISTTALFNLAVLQEEYELVFYVTILFAYMGIFTFLLSYPDGKFHPGWMRLFAIGWAVFIVSTVVSDWFNWESAQAALVIVPGLGAVLYSQVFRYRKVSTPGQREQTKWLIVAIALNVVSVIVTGVANENALAFAGTAESAIYILVGNAAEFLGNLLLVGAVGIAILRYRLWDIEVVVNRALIYGPLSLILAGVFAVVIVLINQSTQQLFGSQATAAAAAVSAIVVATIFTPLRQRIEKWINKRIYPDNVNLARDLVELSPDMRNLLSVKELAQVVADRVCNLMNSRGATVFLAERGPSLRLAARTAGGRSGSSSLKLSQKQHKELAAGKAAGEHGAQLLVPLYVPRLRSKQLVGVLAVGVRKDGRGYSSDDRRALAELGGAVGTAIYAAQLRARSKKR
ncbi:MAG: GAF domain-containing protein [Anaerolineales bacterium]